MEYMAPTMMAPPTYVMASPSSGWSLFEIIGAITVAVVLYVMYTRGSMAPLAAPSATTSSPSFSLFPLSSAVRAPAAPAEPTSAVPTQIKRSLPPNVPLAITQQPSRFGSMFAKWTTDFMDSLFRSDPPTVQGRSSI